MLPKYSKFEIQSLVRKKLDQSTSENIDADQQIVKEILDGGTFWQSRHYKAAATILDTTPEALLEITPGEPLDSVSFRAAENTEEINQKVAEVNDIFELLAYQLKIGQPS